MLSVFSGRLMKHPKLSIALFVVLAACGSSPPPDATSPPAPPRHVVLGPALPVASAASAASGSSALTPKGKAGRCSRRIAPRRRPSAWPSSRDRTPELHAAVKGLATTAYPNGHAAMLAAVAGKHRRPASPERDHDRHPVETFDFFGLKPDMTVLEVAPGEGWFTELLAPVLAKRGKLIATSTDPNGPRRSA